MEIVEINGLSEPVERAVVSQNFLPVDNSAEKAALDKLEEIILECGEILNAAQVIQAGIKSRDLNGIRAGLKVFEDHTERQYHRIIVGYEPGEVYQFLAEVEEEQQAEEYAAAVAELT